MEHDLLEYIKNNIGYKKHSDLTFRVNSTIKLEDDMFTNCTFRFGERGKLILIRPKLYKCRFIGLKASMKGQNSCMLKIESASTLDHGIIEEEFGIVSIQKCSIYSLNANIHSNNFTVIESNVIGFNIQGGCEILNISNSNFTSIDTKDSLWDVEVVRSAICKKTIFHKVLINPFYFATKCEDKSSLDIAGAYLIDDWSRLRKNYSGISLFIVFLLSFIFFLPLLTSSFFLVLTSKIEPIANSYDKIPLWTSLLFGGKSGWFAFAYSILTVVLLTYNILRVYMTISIAKLREEERFLSDSQFKLLSISPEKYQKQLKIDKFLKYLFYISSLYALFKVWDTLSLLVPDFY